MLGHYTAAELDSFWRHCRQLEAWSSHPAWKMNLNPELLVPILLHVDGAEMYASSEYHITSLSSFLSTLTVADIQDKKFLCSMIPHERVQHKRVRRLFGIFWSVSYTAYKHKPQSCYGAFFRNGLAASHRSLSTHVRLGANHRKNPRSELQSTPIWRKCLRGPSDALWRTAGPRQVSTGRSLPETLPGTGMLARSTRHLGGFLPLLLSFPEVLWSL